jgi:hypothetical protein
MYVTVTRVSKEFTLVEFPQGQKYVAIQHLPPLLCPPTLNPGRGLPVSGSLSFTCTFFGDTFCHLFHSAVVL